MHDLRVLFFSFLFFCAALHGSDCEQELYISVALQLTMHRALELARHALGCRREFTFVREEVAALQTTQREVEACASEPCDTDL